MSFLNKLEEISPRKIATKSTEFKRFIDLFVDENIQSERLEFYKKYQKENSLENLAQAKHEIVKSIFGDYVQSNLNKANVLVFHKSNNEAIEIVNEIAELRKVFKTHDILDYKEFVLQSEPNITHAEVDLLFYEPLLNGKELEKLTNAFIKALGKKNTISDLEDFQRKFFTHPLIECLDAYIDLSDIKDSVEDDSLELFNYKNLVSLILEVKQKVNAEEYQAFITFVIKEDLTKGFANIIKDREYEPKYLTEILKSISLGKNLENSELNKLIEEIKRNHTENLKLEKGELKYVNTSNQSFNDYGFSIKEKGLDVFFHGHATENHGEKQAEQQANTGLNIDISNAFENNIGLTVTKFSVLKNDHHKTFLRREGLDDNLNVTKTEEIVMSNLIFDASYLKRLIKKVDDAVNKGENPVAKLRESKIFSTNHLIVKEDIIRSQKIILSNIGKNDFELLCEKKNAYMNILTKNKAFFNDALTQGSTNNYLVFELIGKPTMSLLSNLLEMEEITNVKLFDDNEISFIKEIASLDKRNATLDSDSVTINRTLRRRDSGKLEDINVDTFHFLKKFAEADKSKKDTFQKANNSVRDHAQRISKMDLGSALYYLDKNPLNNKDYNQKYKTRLANALIKNIESSTEELLKYRKDKVKSLSDGIELTCSLLKDGASVVFAPSDWQATTFAYAPEYKSMATLLKDKDKTQEQIINDRLLLRSILKVAELTGGKLLCKSRDLSAKVKPV